MSFRDNFLGFLSELDEFTMALVMHRLKIGGGYFPRSTYYATINRLAKQGLVKKKRVKRIIRVSITDKGRKLLKKPIRKKRREDDFSTVVIFDIPEKQRKAREGLRRYLMRSGYINLQKSVMIAPFEAGRELKELIEELKIKSSVTVLLGKIDYYFKS